VLLICLYLCCIVCKLKKERNNGRGQGQQVSTNRLGPDGKGIVHENPVYDGPNSKGGIGHNESYVPETEFDNAMDSGVPTWDNGKNSMPSQYLTMEPSDNGFALGGPSSYLHMNPADNSDYPESHSTSNGSQYLTLEGRDGDLDSEEQAAIQFALAEAGGSVTPRYEDETYLGILPAGDGASDDDARSFDDPPPPPPTTTVSSYDDGYDL
jgi:hypothetical protein